MDVLSISHLPSTEMKLIITDDVVFIHIYRGRINEDNVSYVIYVAVLICTDNLNFLGLVSHTFDVSIITQRCVEWETFCHANNMNRIEIAILLANANFGLALLICGQ